MTIQELAKEKLNEHIPFGSSFTTREAYIHMAVLNFGLETNVSSIERKLFIFKGCLEKEYNEALLEAAVFNEAMKSYPWADHIKGFEPFVIE